MDNSNNTQSILSLCPGILGLERGIDRAIRTLAADWNIPLRGGKAINVVAYVEIEAFIIANLVGQMETGLLDPAPIWTNVKTFDAQPFRNKIHGIIGGYPCQPFSHAGKRAGIEDERHLWPYILEQIKIIRPEWVCFENVAGHLSLGYDDVRKSLSGIGYRIEEGVFTAEEVGAPHRRERLFILGVMENAGILGWRGRCVGDQAGSECADQTTGSGTTLDNTHCECEHRCSSTCGRWQSEYSVSSANVGNAKGINKQHDGPIEQAPHIQNRRPSPNVVNTDSKLIYLSKRESGQERKTQGSYFNAKSASVELDNSFQSRLEGHAGDGSREERWPEQERSTTAASLFPAGQGTFQYEWEEPRTIESGIFYTIDGYNFTEDLHRAIGNSVVEQTAELAFITLLNKHIKNLQP